MVETWVAVLGALATGVLGYLGHFIQARVASKDTQDTLRDARRAEVLDHMRWSMERMVSRDGEQRRLGVGQLQALRSNPYLDPEDKRRIFAASTAALVAVVGPWDTEHIVAIEEGEQA